MKNRRPQTSNPSSHSPRGRETETASLMGLTSETSSSVEGLEESFYRGGLGEAQPLTLYELNQMVGEVISLSMPDDYWVEAELSEAREVRGHCYMELVQKDLFGNTPVARASAKCWKSTWMLIRPRFERVTGQQLHAGMKVMLKVRADFHAAYGFSWIVSDIDPTYTMGDMARRRQEIVNQLQQEGVFDLQKELEIPMFAQRIAVVSSENAAGYGDFCNQLADNEYGFVFRTRLFPAIMQGEQVEQSVIAALNRINEMVDDFDVVVIIRGGGATADLSGFDTLALAENVANFPLPIITGIGHDRDESVLDMVSHTRVKTPTAAAAFLIDHLAEVNARIDDCLSDIVACVNRRMEMERMRLERLSGKIPLMFSLAKSRQMARLDGFSACLAASCKEHLLRAAHHVDVLASAIPSAVQQRMMKERHRIDLMEQRAKALDPSLLLKRGFSITMHEGKVVRDASTLNEGDKLETRLENGWVTSIVSRRNPE